VPCLENFEKLRLLVEQMASPMNHWKRAERSDSLRFDPFWEPPEKVAKLPGFVNLRWAVE
jgi:hypothetical protein